jgi:outer membrane lipoprotein-sorting protein
MKTKFISLKMAGILGLLVLSSAASAFAERPKFLLISFDENFTSDSTIDGTTALAGAFSDTGTRHYTFTTQQRGDEVVVTGTILITASQGTISAKFKGTIPANGSNPNYIEGNETLTSGTGAYAGIKNVEGTFEATIDFNSGNIVGVGEFLVRNRR